MSFPHSYSSYPNPFDWRSDCDLDGFDGNRLIHCFSLWLRFLGRAMRARTVACRGHGRTTTYPQTFRLVNKLRLTDNSTSWCVTRNSKYCFSAWRSWNGRRSWTLSKVLVSFRLAQRTSVPTANLLYFSYERMLLLHSFAVNICRTGRDANIALS